MRSFYILFVLFFLFSISFPFSIDSYQSNAVVLHNGDLLLNEEISFTLEKQYNEGYRSIRPADYTTLENIQVHSVSVNGEPVPYYTQEYEGNGEIVWTKTFEGRNVVELNYTLKNRVELWDDYAKICFEHYGANWKVPAKTFNSKMKLPEASRGKEMHFEVYSAKKGDAHIEDLEILISENNVPSGNYIGACYLFDKSAVTTNRTVSGSAFEILKDEREAYNSETLFGPEDSFPCAPCCFPVFLVLLVIAGYIAQQRPKFEKLSPSLFPPYSEQPVVVSALMRGKYEEKDILASTILELINKGVIDILELEKKGYSGQKINREHTILFLKTSSKKLAPHEKTVVDLIFNGGKTKEVDLDAMAEKFDALQNKTEAKNTHISTKLDEFKQQITDVLKEKKLYKPTKEHKEKTQFVTSVSIFALLFIGFFSLPLLFGLAEFSTYLFSIGNYAYLAYLFIGIMGTVSAIAVLIYYFFLPNIPKGWEKKYAQWNAFSDAVKSSSLKEEPPSAA